MIYQLVKLKTLPFMRARALFFGGVFLLFACGLHFISSVAPAEPPILMIAGLVMLGSLAGLRWTRFDAALPIRPRDVFCARVLTTVTSLWLLLLMAFATIRVSPNTSNTGATAFIFEAGAIVTMAVIAVQSVRVGDNRAPLWWRGVVGIAAVVSMGGMGILSVDTHATSGLVAQAVCTAAICAVGSAALFWKTWSAHPESFQIAPQESAIEKSQKSTRWLPLPPWWPAMRLFFDILSLVFFSILLFLGIVGALFSGINVVFLSLLLMISRLRYNYRWLFLLPISRQTLFAMMALPPLGCFALGSLIHLHFSSQPAGVFILGLAAVTAIALLTLSAVDIPYFAPHLRPGWAGLLTCTAFSLLFWASWRWFVPWRTRTAPIEALFRSIPAARLPLFMVIAFTVVAASCWLAYQGFRRMQILPQRMPPVR